MNEILDCPLTQDGVIAEKSCPPTRAFVCKKAALTFGRKKKEVIKTKKRRSRAHVSQDTTVWHASGSERYTDNYSLAGRVVKARDDSQRNRL
jgi:hypothetical protein